MKKFLASLIASAFAFNVFAAPPTTAATAANVHRLRSLKYVICAWLFLAGMAWAQEQARVITSTPTLVPSSTLDSNGQVVMLTVFNVLYDYAGKQYAVQMPHDPGPYVTLQISPTYSASTSAPPLPPAPQVIYIQNPPQVLSNPVYVMPYSPPYYYSNPFPFTFNFGLGYYRWRR